MEDGSGVVGRTAAEIAAAVRSGEMRPEAVLAPHLERIAALDRRLGAFQLVRAERAAAEARALEERADLTDLPLAGVPVAVKDNVDVAGEPTRNGSRATAAAPRPRDHEVVRRLREAGAVVVGKTRVPELCVWGTTDGAFGVARNPWDPGRTPGGSSGGAAAAVSAAMVPVAQGSDGMGSIRIPAACCGLVGIKPGAGVVPSAMGVSSWFGMSEHGPLAATVGDAALVLSVMARREDLSEPRPPDRPLRIAVSLRPPSPGLPVGREFRAAVLRTAEALAGAGHRVTESPVPRPVRANATLVARWFAGVAEDAEGLDPRLLEPRTRRHVLVGRRILGRGWVRPASVDRFRALMAPLFRSHDVLLTLTLAAPPIAAEGWSRRSWGANLEANARYAPFASSWNLARWPAMVVPAGRHPAGVPLSVQLVAPAGGEALLLSVARQLEILRPWPRHAPLGG